MIFAKGSDTFDITANSGSSTSQISCDILLAKAKEYGYNAVLIVPAFNNSVYEGQFLNIKIENNSVYFLDNYSYFGQKYFLAYATDYFNHYAYSNNGSAEVATGTSMAITSYTWNGKEYKGFIRGNESLEPVFYTDLAYSHAYIDDVEQPLPAVTTSGGAGSGYIGNSLLSNKKMVGYNVPTSSAESTKTESVNEASENPVSGKPKIGNGFARIKFLRAVTDFVLIDSYNDYHNPIVDLSNTGWKDGNQTTRWQYLQDGTFESYDNTQAQTKCVFNTKMKKGSAVNLCIECTTENIAAYPDFGFGLLSSMPTAWGYPSGGDRGTVLKWLYDFANTTKGTYKMSLSDVSADAEFYLCFYNNSTENIVYKVWFEGIPVFVS